MYMSVYDNFWWDYECYCFFFFLVEVVDFEALLTVNAVTKIFIVSTVLTIFRFESNAIIFFSNELFLLFFCTTYN